MYTLREGLGRLIEPPSLIQYLMMMNESLMSLSWPSLYEIDWDSYSFQSKKCIIKTNIDVKFTTCVRHVSCLASVEFGSALDELIFYERGAS